MRCSLRCPANRLICYWPIWLSRRVIHWRLPPVPRSPWMSSPTGQCESYAFGTCAQCFWQRSPIPHSRAFHDAGDDVDSPNESHLIWQNIYAFRIAIDFFLPHQFGAATRPVSACVCVCVRLIYEPYESKKSVTNFMTLFFHASSYILPFIPSPSAGRDVDILIWQASMTI